MTVDQTTDEVVIRPLRIDERADWEPLWKGYQALLRDRLPDSTTAVTWARLHDPAEPMGALGAYVDGRLCGIAHYIFHRSCWTRRRLLLPAGPVRGRKLRADAGSAAG